VSGEAIEHFFSDCEGILTFDIISRPSRRGFMGALVLVATAFTTRGAFADDLKRTPRIPEGPYYPTKLPLDADNDLIRINDTITSAVGGIFTPSAQATRQAGGADVAVSIPR
jgi:hypothetical protein